MATDRQIVKAGDEFEQAFEILRALKERKQQLQDQLLETNARIDEQQIVVDSLRFSLKTLVNE